jgi:hypothetical protein
MKTIAKVKLIKAKFIQQKIYGHGWLKQIQ